MRLDHGSFDRIFAFIDALVETIELVRFIATSGIVNHLAFKVLVMVEVIPHVDRRTVTPAIKRLETSI